ncbi:uncharacterized protein LOC126899923 [Daktulosphaira vitifoliae]|uniref:uncharacterized protein LOC126899923 n=1 Tax=Daktulosphaira vitifoliae TaxID=58002 RepID=UPI0021AAA73A|nr:uncharacterized protein LOC126899923 [Daktulosphaira vitifoliae]XP_050531161.1 uncharacterized protein LOC126899923 [Daktulosphaira vitifoliae]XP_050531162.1 uncharacterized protein LOC126899923 [Daktulosphaira vitifoliae]
MTTNGNYSSSRTKRKLDEEPPGCSTDGQRRNKIPNRGRDRVVETAPIVVLSSSSSSADSDSEVEETSSSSSSSSNSDTEVEETSSRSSATAASSERLHGIAIPVIDNHVQSFDVSSDWEWESDNENGGVGDLVADIERVVERMEPRAAAIGRHGSRRRSAAIDLTGIGDEPCEWDFDSDYSDYYDDSSSSSNGSYGSEDDGELLDDEAAAAAAEERDHRRRTKNGRTAADRGGGVGRRRLDKSVRLILQAYANSSREPNRYQFQTDLLPPPRPPVPGRAVASRTDEYTASVRESLDFKRTLNNMCRSLANTGIATARPESVTSNGGGGGESSSIVVVDVRSGVSRLSVETETLSNVLEKYDLETICSSSNEDGGGGTTADQLLVESAHNWGELIAKIDTRTPVPAAARQIPSPSRFRSPPRSPPSPPQPQRFSPGCIVLSDDNDDDDDALATAVGRNDDNSLLNICVPPIGGRALHPVRRNVLEFQIDDEDDNDARVELQSPEPEELFPGYCPELLRSMQERFNRKRLVDHVLDPSTSNLRVKDVLTVFSPRQWLNDEAVNHYLGLVEARSSGRVMAHNTFFYTTLVTAGYARVRRWTRKVDVFGKRMLLVPVHNNNHWSLLCANFVTRTISYYDSVGLSNNQCVRALFYYLAAEHADKKGTQFDIDDWTLEMAECPAQTNTHDCGVFACVNAERLARDAPLNYSQKDAIVLRHRMVYELLNNKLCH